MFCTKCGNELPEGSKFCSKCCAAREKYPRLNKAITYAKYNVCGLIVLLLVAIAFVRCGNSNSNGYLGDTLNLSGQVYTVQQDEEGKNTYTEFTGDLDLMEDAEPGFGYAKIKKGKLSCKIVWKPDHNDLDEISELVDEIEHEGWKQVVASNETVEYYVLASFPVEDSNDFEYLTKNITDKEGPSRKVSYIYFTKNVNITGKGKTNKFNDSYLNVNKTTDFNLQFKKGWNALLSSKQFLYNEKTMKMEIESSLTISNPSSVKWGLYNNYLYNSLWW